MDKGQLIKAAQSAGLETPRTWLPQSDADVEKLARELRSTSALVKPRSQLAVRNYIKGAVASPNGKGISALYDRIRAYGAHDPDFASRHPEVMWPMIQEYHPESAEHVYSLSGYRDISGEHFAVLASNKILQRPRRLGIGLCFDHAEIDADLALKVRELCERVGYYGAFEVEFIVADGRALLIDFNARFYSQIAFDIERGLNLPNLVYSAMVGRPDDVAHAIASFHERKSNRKYAYCNGFQFNLTVRAQSALGSMSREDAVRWHAWRSRPDITLVDATLDPVDPLPSRMDVVQQLLAMMRHPRSFFREVAFAS
ncbi:MAG: hypothetical protein JSS20_14725 [Proteobacteria bacterium]|nr:hypothetical protein [Pseudomonadota bacterium]